LNYLLKERKRNRHLKRFISKYTKWMASKITILVSDFENPKTPQQMGRRDLSYQNSGGRFKRKLSSNLASESDHDTSLLIHAATVSARKECKNETLTPEFPSESRMHIQWQKPTPLSPPLSKHSDKTAMYKHQAFK